MRTIELTGDVNKEHRLQAEVPADLPPGPVRLILLAPDEDAADAVWSHALAQEWAVDLADPRQDIYTLEDGQPVSEEG